MRSTRPDYATCIRMVRKHLPSMLPIVEELTELAGGADDVARFLTLYCPPPSIRGCTQAVWMTGDERALIRNYDFAPRLCDGVVLRCAWGGVQTIALTDCLIGALDGMNDQGVAASLSFGGDRVVGEGFGTTLLIRAILQECASVKDCTQLLRRTPVHMAYNVTVLDQEGDYATVRLHPERKAEVTSNPVAANHQGRVAWPRYATASCTVEREAHAQSLLRDPAVLESDDPLAFAQRFLTPPLFRTEYAKSSGTLYTAVYQPCAGALDLLWRDAKRSVSFENFNTETYVARYNG